MSPPAASYMRPGAGLYVYMCIYIFILKKKQVRLHRNIAASSLAADCNVPQRPPAQVEVLQQFRCHVKVEVLHLFTDVSHTHTPSRGRVGKLRSGQ